MSNNKRLVVRKSPEVCDEICALIAGGLSLRAVCRMDTMPSVTAFMKWLDKDSELVEQYAHATRQRADHIFEECLEIADNATQDINELGMVNQENIQRARLKIDTRKWMLGKMTPKKYGDKIEVDSTIRGSIDNRIEIVTKSEIDLEDIGFKES